MALVAAMRPKSKGLSTIGIKKSVVLITLVPLPRSYTAASSRVSLPTSKFGSTNFACSLCRMVSNTFGEILQPQPAPWLYWVKRIEFSLMDISCQCNPGMVTLIP
ncbi:Uncharacterised protein [Shigella sonnei]|nr:Uncharacterised protein [Shigella sonnei]SRN36514.1 Uncharacterised protein [Shigella flexneri]